MFKMNQGDNDGSLVLRKCDYVPEIFFIVFKRIEK